MYVLLLTVMCAGPYCMITHDWPYCNNNQVCTCVVARTSPIGWGNYISWLKIRWCWFNKVNNNCMWRSAVNAHTKFNMHGRCTKQSMQLYKIVTYNVILTGRCWRACEGSHKYAYACTLTQIILMCMDSLKVTQTEQSMQLYMQTFTYNVIDAEGNTLHVFMNHIVCEHHNIMESYIL